MCNNAMCGCDKTGLAVPAGVIVAAAMVVMNGAAAAAFTWVGDVVTAMLIVTMMIVVNAATLICGLVWKEWLAPQRRRTRPAVRSQPAVQPTPTVPPAAQPVVLREITREVQMPAGWQPNMQPTQSHKVIEGQVAR